MKISTKSQYALEALIDLMLNATDGQEPLKNIAVRRGISEPYLDQIFALLRKAGIVESVRGAQGGYKLSREPRAITVGEVIRSAEGRLYPVKCIVAKTEDGVGCHMMDRCATRPLWMRLSSEIDSAVDAITLADLADACRDSLSGSAAQYSI